MTTPRVLVVDDSAFARTALTRILRTGGVDVVGTARDGDDALARIAELDPDLITLDLTMPGRDGLDVLRALAARPRPRAIIVSVSTIDSASAIEALALGAIDLVSKPSALATDRLYELGEELVAKVLAAAPSAPRLEPLAAVPARAVAAAAELVLIGTSTGGPQALTRLLAALPADLAAPVAIVLHIPVGYTEALARRLDGSSPLEVLEASPGIELHPGRAVLARAGHHLKLARERGRIVGRLDVLPIRPHTPSVDELFLSGVELLGSRVLGVVLTGMGDDGLVGARAIAASGGALLTESATSCIVYGMPRVVAEADLGARSAPLDQLHHEIIRHVAKR